MRNMMRSGWLLTLCLAWGCTGQKLSDTPAPAVSDAASPAVSDSPAPAIDVLADPEPEERTLPEPVATGQPVTVTDEDFEQKVLRSSVPVLVDIWADWCPPCRVLAPIMDDLAAEYQGRAIVAKLDHDANPATPGKYQVKNLPTMILFKDGQPVNTLVGLKSREEIARALDSLLGS